MDYLDNYGVQEIENYSAQHTQGGTWLGQAVGKLVGSMFRYSGVYGSAQLQVDYAISNIK